MSQPVANQTNQPQPPTWKERVASAFANIHRATASCFAIILLVSVVVSYFAQDKNFIVFAFLMEIGYLLLSIKTVGAQEVAVILFFEKPIESRESGFNLVPWLVCRLETFPKTAIQRQFPDDPENVDKSGEDSRPVPIGPNGKPMVKPLRITTASPESALKMDPPGKTNYDPDPGDKGPNKADPLNKRMTVEVSAIVRFRISDPKRFISTIGSETEAVRQIRDTVEIVIRAELAKRTTAQVLADLELVNNILEQEVRELVNDQYQDPALPKIPNPPPGPNNWGIDLSDVQIVDIDIGKKMNEELRSRAAAEVKKQTTITLAEADKEKAIKEAEGKAESTRKTADADGWAVERMATANSAKILQEGKATGAALWELLKNRANGLELIAKKLGVSTGEVILIAEMMEKGFDKAQHTFFFGGEGITSATSILAKVQQALAEIKKETTS